MPKCLECSHAGKHPFCSLEQEPRVFLESNCAVQHYVRGSALFREGDEADAIYVVCSGRVKVSSSSQDGRTLIVRIADAGDVLGMSAALTGGNFEVTAEAMEPCRVRVLNLRNLNSMMQQYAGASMAVAKSLAEDYRAVFNEARLIALPGSPAGRVARLLLDWADEARRNSSAFITMSMTHDEVASMTATTRETVTRTLSRFRKEKIIATRGVALTVLQPWVLEELSA